MKSYFIDTNYFLRFLLKDNEEQFKKILFIFKLAIDKKINLYTSVIVFFELYWVLRSFYKNNKKNCVDLLSKIIKINFIDFENKEIIQEALTLFEKTNLDLEDCYNLSYSKKINIDELATFDKKLLKNFKK